jgi:hypothetical protein
MDTSGGGDYTDKPSVMFPGIVLGRLYKFPFGVFAATEAGQYNFFYGLATDSDTFLPQETKLSDPYSDKFTHTHPVLEAGTVLTSVQ